MTYRHEGNDPRSHAYLSPAEVKAMLTGGGSAPDYRDIDSQAALPEAPGFRKTSGTPQEVAGEVMVWLNGEHTIRARALAQREGRCYPCGRAFACCCQGCETCPQSKMEAGKISAAWAARQVALGGTDPREMS